MKTILSNCFAAVLMMLLQPALYAQMVTTDPLHTGVTTAIKFFQEPSFTQLVGNVKKLTQISKFIQNVSRGVEMAQEAQKTLKLINEYGAIMSKDGHLLSVEYQMISKDFTSFAREVRTIVEDLGTVVQANRGSTMTDEGRLDGVYKASQSLKKLNSSISQYVGNVKLVSQKRAKDYNDKIATSKLYSLASNSLSSGGSVGSVDPFAGWTYSNPGDYDNEGLNFNLEQKMAQEMNINQQALNREYQDKMDMATLEEKAKAAIAIPKISKEGFYGQKMAEGVCPNPPQPSPNGRGFIHQSLSMGADSSVQVQTTIDNGDNDAFQRALKKWEYDMENFCSALYDIYEKQVDLERQKYMSANLNPQLKALREELAQKLLDAQATIKEKYKGKTTTISKEESEQEYYKN